MWTELKINYKIVLATFGFLIVGMVFGYLSEDFYRRFIRYLFKIFSGDKIEFIGKNFHFLASFKFVCAFGIFLFSIFLLSRQLKFIEKIKKFTILIITFFISTISISAFESNRLIIECTACNDGVRKLTYNQISYDSYFIISLIISFLLLLIIIKYKKVKTMNFKILLIISIFSCQISCRQTKNERIELGIENAKKELKQALTNKAEKQILVEKIISDQKMATEFSKTILFKIYGENNIIIQRPYEINHIENYWILNGTLPKNMDGGTFLIIINEINGQIIKLTHGK